MLQLSENPKMFSTNITVVSLLTLWPTINIIFGTYTYVALDDKHCFFFLHFIEYLTVVAAFFQYACFSYLLYSLRKAFTARFNNILDDIEPFDPNEYKSRLCQIYFEYRDFRNLVDGWMTFVLAFGVLGITTQISYMYAFNESKYSSNAQLKHKVTTYSLMIWSQKFMFLLQPIFVFDGINVDYLWRGLKRRVSKKLTAKATVGSLNKIIAHMDKINVSSRWIIPSLGFSFVGLYLGLHLPKQYIKFWFGVCVSDSATNKSDTMV